MTTWSARTRLPSAASDTLGWAAAAAGWTATPARAAAAREGTAGDGFSDRAAARRGKWRSRICKGYGSVRAHPSTGQLS